MDQKKMATVFEAIIGMYGYIEVGEPHVCTKSDHQCHYNLYDHIAATSKITLPEVVSSFLVGNTFNQYVLYYCRM